MLNLSRVTVVMLVLLMTVMVADCGKRDRRKYGSQWGKQNEREREESERKDHS